MSATVGGAKALINNLFVDKEPWQIVTITTTTVLTSIWLWNFYNNVDSEFSQLICN